MEREGKVGDGDDGASITFSYVFFYLRGVAGRKHRAKSGVSFGKQTFFFSFSLCLSVYLLVWSRKRVRFGWLDVQKMCHVGDIVLYILVLVMGLMLGKWSA